jgi:cytoskeletal protein CcmA (bactofilin family)
MAVVLGNRAKMSTSTTGTGTITLGSALSGYQTFAQAGITNGQTVRYAIEDGTNFEIGSGVFTSSGTTLTRNVTESSNSDSAISLSGSAEVFITASAADIFVNDGATSLTTTGTITAGGNVAISTGVIDLKNGGSQSVVKFYCESSNAHYAEIKAPAHGLFSGNVTLTLPATTDTIAGIAATQTFTNKTLTAPKINEDVAVTSTATELNILDGVTTTTAEINLIDGGTARGTTAVASGDGILINDAGTMRMTNVDTVSTYFSSISVGGGNIVTTGALNSGSITSGFGAINNGSSNITTTGVGTFGSLDISGNIDIDGTTNLDAVDIDGAVQLDATLTVGVDDTGYDVKFFGDAASAFMQWDASADDLILGGAAGLIVPEGQFTLGSTAVTSTAAELNLVDGISAGTVSASKAVIVDSNKDLTGGRNLTISGELDAATLDISGNADIDGTLETDGLTVGGVAAKVAGKESIYVPATAMYPSTTNPCSDLTQVETTALRPDLKVLDFADGADDFAQFSVAFPKSWNEGTVTFQPFWTVTGTNTGTVAWQLAGVAITSDESINTAFGTQVATTALAFSGTSNDLMVSAESGAVTIAGSPAAADMCFFQINRDISADTQTGDARLLGVKLLFTTDAANDA